MIEVSSASLVLHELLCLVLSYVAFLNILKLSILDFLHGFGVLSHCSILQHLV